MAPVGAGALSLNLSMSLNVSPTDNANKIVEIANSSDFRCEVSVLTNSTDVRFHSKTLEM